MKQETKEKLANVVTKLFLVAMIVAIMTIGYRAFRGTVTTIIELVINPFLNEPLPQINFFKFIWYMFFITVSGFITSIFTSMLILGLRSVKEIMREDHDPGGAAGKIVNVILNQYAPKALKFSWVIGILYVLLIIILGYDLSFFKGMYLWGISYFLIVTLYVWINTIVASLIIKIDEKNEGEN